MPKYGYAFQGFDASRHVRASLREKQISHKHAREIAAAVGGMDLDRARSYLQDVAAGRRAVPFRRYNGQVGHRPDPGVMSGRYPAKAAREFVKLIDNLESNAEYRGMDTDRLRIVGAAAHKGVSIKRFTPRAQGRATPKNNVLTHVEMVAREA